MLYSRDYKKIALGALQGRWALAVGTGFVAAILGGDITGLRNSSGNTSANNQISTTVENCNSPFSAFAENGKLMISNNTFSDFVNRIKQSEFGTEIQVVLIGLVVILILWVLVRIIIGGATTLGYARFNLNLIDRNNTQFNELFSQFHRIGAGFCMHFLRGLYILLWTLLLIIPGIIATYSYTMTAYIMAEHPEYGANEAIGMSKDLMRGNKWRFFCLQFSFIGWFLLSILTIGIGFLWVIPYIEAANAAFYRDISRENFGDAPIGIDM